ncbi:hypothetical protein ESCO_004556 [Escovopsis weberi]|uniref:Uncharacterized protein n=1 Tax=Escovopsis weberi TaxID=150374 RepID=A0A0M9VVQ6_ESCWE|nr:hypothetical protein ESCO_004556 [Escovopsis weberi]
MSQAHGRKQDPSAEHPEAPEGQVRDASYATKQNDPVPVQSDDTEVDDPIKGEAADTDQQLERDEKEAVDKSNIIHERTRGAKPQASYKQQLDQLEGE